MLVKLWLGGPSRCTFSGQLQYKSFPLSSQSSLVINTGSAPERRSTITQLLDFVQQLYIALDSREDYQVLYFDFQKAFDKISHTILLSKLEKFGFAVIRTNRFSIT